MDVTQSRSGVTRERPYLQVDPLRCDPNKIVEAYGFWGRYQWWTVVQCTFVMFFYAANMHLMPFITGLSRVDCQVENRTLHNLSGCGYRSHDDDDDDGDDGVCGGTAESRVLGYRDTAPQTSLLFEFGWHCVDEFWREAGQTAFTLGALLVVPFFSYLADHCGRKPIFLLTVYGSILANFACAAAPSIWCFVALRFVVGALSDSYYTVSASFVCELFSERQRTFVGLVETSFWAMGILYVGLLTLYVSNWRLLYMYMTLPSVVYFVMIFTLPESPHWAVQHRRRRRVQNYICAADRWNRDRLDLVTCLSANPNEQQPAVNSVAEMLRMLRSFTMWKIMLLAGGMSLIMNFTYFAISLEAIDLSEDHFTAYMLNGIADLPGCAASIPLIHFFGRKWVAISSGVMCGVLLAAAPFALTVLGLNWLKVALILLSKFANTITQTLIPIWFPEMLPTTVRIIGFSIINVPQCIGQVIAPFFRHVRFEWPPTKYLAVGVVCVIFSVLCSFLEDTKGKDMPGLLHEVAPRSPSLQVTQPASSGEDDDNDDSTRSAS